MKRKATTCKCKHTMKGGSKRKVVRRKRVVRRRRQKGGIGFGDILSGISMIPSRFPTSAEMMNNLSPFHMYQANFKNNPNDLLNEASMLL